MSIARTPLKQALAFVIAVSLLVSFAYGAWAIWRELTLKPLTMHLPKAAQTGRR